MKKVLIILLLLALSVSLFSCSGYYDPIKSTEEENTTVLILEVGGEQYEVKYELYRGLFLNIKSEIDGGDDSVWSGENKDEYIDLANERIIGFVTEIYAAFAVCEDIGFDVYSSDVDKQIKEYIKLAVESEPHNGDYDSYLASLKEANLNYSAQELILRWGIAMDAIDEHYIGTATADDISGEIVVGEISYTKESIREYYYSDKCVRVLRTFVSSVIDNDPAARAERIREDIRDVAHKGKNAVADAMISNRSTTATNELENGYVIGRYNLNTFYYSELTEVAFSLQEGEVSRVVPVTEDSGKNYYIMYRCEKDDEHLEKCYTEIATIFLNDMVGGIINEKQVALETSALPTDFLNNLNYAEISME